MITVATCIFGSCIEVFRPWLQCPTFSYNRCQVNMAIVLYTHTAPQMIQTRHKNKNVFFSSYTGLWSFMVDWHWDLFWLFRYFHILGLSAFSVPWSWFSWSFGATLISSGIFFELYCVRVELIEKMKPLPRLHFGLISCTHHQRVYGGGVNTQLWNN